MHIRNVATALVFVSYVHGMPTVGGTIFFHANYFGATGNLAPAESITIGSKTCANPVVVNATTLSCTLPEGIGSDFQVSLTLCGTQHSAPILSYFAPEIDTIVIKETYLEIIGTNFGPQRSLEAGESLTVLEYGAPCDLIFLNHTLIQCSIPNGLNQITINLYNISVVLGGHESIIQIGDPSIVPVTTGTTATTGTTGTTATTGTTGEPIHATEETGEFIKEDSHDGSGNIIIFVAGGVGVVAVILLVLLSILIIRRKQKTSETELQERPKSSTISFIPLEKKNFTPLIFGELKQPTAAQKSSAGKLNLFEKMLVEDQQFKLVFAIAQVTQITEADTISKALVIVSEDHHQTLPLLGAFIQDEIRRSDSAGTIFRSNSHVSKMFKFYSRMIGLPYLYEVLGREIHQLISEDLGLEMDPDRMEEGQDMDEMRWMLMAQTQKVLKAILNSVNQCPMQLRVVMAYVAKYVKDKFPDNIHTTIGGFIFLRFFCPAVSAPESCGLMEEPPSPKARRLLVLMTKALQNLSNNLEFGQKEKFMAGINDFIHSNRPKLNDFFNNLIAVDTENLDQSLMAQGPAIRKEVKEYSLIVLSSHLRTNLGKVKDEELRSSLEQFYAQ